MKTLISCIWPLTCPVCRRPLSRSGSALRCDGRHSFDLAREGYVNLLPRNRPLSTTVGDAPEMLAARRAFLEAGYYAPLANLIGAAALSHLRGEARRRSDKPAVVLDAGCGEGYYIGAMQAVLERPTETTAAVRSFGIDIAKNAVRLAARRHLGTLFAVADSTKRLPFLDGSVDVLLDVFAPRSAEEFARVVAPAGLFLCVIPAIDHLQSLRDSLPLLGIEQNKAEHVAAQLEAAFEQRGAEELRFELGLTSDALRRLVTMMPSYRHFGPQDWQTLAALGPVSTTAAFTLLRFERRAGAEQL